LADQHFNLMFFVAVERLEVRRLDPLTIDPKQFVPLFDGPAGDFGMETFSPSDQKLEIDRTVDAFTGLGLPKPSLYRPPYGAYDQTTLALLKKRKMLLVLWDVDTLDWTRPGADAIVQTALSQVQSGSIILMHDGGGDRTQTLAALPRIIEGLRQLGYQMVTLPTLLVEDPPRPGETPPPVGVGA
jgi:hypothetical protein